MYVTSQAKERKKAGQNFLIAERLTIKAAEQLDYI